MAQALYIAFGGMAIIFACMIVLLLAMMLMTKLFRVKGTRSNTKES